MPQPMFIALEPDPRLTQFLLDAKARAHRLVGDQLYLSDPPHLTLYLAYFDAVEPVLERLHTLKLPKIQGQILGWHIFEADVLTGRNTLVCEIDPRDKPALRGIQQQVIDAIHLLRDPDATANRYAKSRANLSIERQQAIDQVGFPFIGEDWQPHFSVGSILPNDWPPVWHELEPTPPPREFACPLLKLYRLDGITPVLVQAFDIAP